MDYLEIRALYHHGIKGQKWGLRRYQNEDGTLTAEGKKRYNKDILGKDLTYDKEKGRYYYEDKDGNRIYEKTQASHLDDKDISDLNMRVIQEERLMDAHDKTYERKGASAADVLSETSKFSNDLARAIPTGTGKYIKKDYSSLSNEELSNRIRRLELESKYGQLSGDTKYVKSGGEKTREILQTAGATLAIGATAARLVTTILDYKKGHKKDSAIDEDELSHHGVKGQKWGVRKERDYDDEASSDYEVEQAKKSRRNKILVGALVTAATVAIGTAYIKRKLSKNSAASDSSSTNKPKAVEKVKATVVKDTIKATKPKSSGAGVIIDAEFRDVSRGASFVGSLLPSVNSAPRRNVIGTITPKLLTHSDIAELVHHGIKGQKWGVRRFQEANGALTPEGKKRYYLNEGTKEIIKNTGSYKGFVKKYQNSYTKYGKLAGAKRGFLLGMGTGAAMGIGKVAIDILTNKGSKKASSNEVVNRFIRNAIVGSLGGAAVGTLLGGIAGKNSAEAQLAEKGKEYTDVILNTPVDRLRKGSR